MGNRDKCPRSKRKMLNTLVNRKMKIKTTMRYHYTREMAKILTIPVLVKIRNPVDQLAYFWQKYKFCVHFGGKIWLFL